MARKKTTVKANPPSKPSLGTNKEAKARMEEWEYDNAERIFDGMTAADAEREGLTPEIVAENVAHAIIWYYACESVCSGRRFTEEHHVKTPNPLILEIARYEAQRLAYLIGQESPPGNVLAAAAKRGIERAWSDQSEARKKNWEKINARQAKEEAAGQEKARAIAIERQRRQEQEKAERIRAANETILNAYDETRGEDGEPRLRYMAAALWKTHLDQIDLDEATECFFDFFLSDCKEYGGWEKIGEIVRDEQQKEQERRRGELTAKIAEERAAREAKAAAEKAEADRKAFEARAMKAAKGFGHVEANGKPAPEEVALIDGVLWAMRCLYLAGPFKCMKSGIAMDLAVSLASGTPFLGIFNVPRAVRVSYFSGELGYPELAARIGNICRARGVEYGKVRENLIIYERLPYPADPYNRQELLDVLRFTKPEVMIHDCLYLTAKALKYIVEGEDGEEIAPSNRSDMGKMLQDYRDAIHRCGTTLIIVDHFLKNTKRKWWPEHSMIMGSGVVNSTVGLYSC